MDITSLLVVILSIPLLVNILLPLLMLASWLLFQPVKRLFPRVLDGTEKRAEKRIVTPGLLAEISDGQGVYEGVVTNMSMFGVCLSNIPERLLVSKSKLSVTIKDKTEEYRLLVTPSWNQMDRVMGCAIGGRLDTAPPRWRDFVHAY